MHEEPLPPNPTRRVWAIFRKDRQVLAISDAEIVLVRLPLGASPPGLPEATELVPETSDLLLEDVTSLGEVRGRIPGDQLRFAEISGSVLMLQGHTDIPYVLAPEEEAAAEAVVRRLTGRRVEYFLADVAKDIWKWNVGMAALGALALLVPVFETSWGIVVVLAAAVGLAIRRPVCYLTYAVLCFGGALSNTAAHVRGRPGGWLIAVLLMGFLGVVTLRRWIQFRHARTSKDLHAALVPGWLAPAALALTLLGIVLLATANYAPQVIERLVPNGLDVRVWVESALRLPGHLGLLALGLALSGTERGRWAGPACLLAVLLFVSLVAVNLTLRAEKERLRMEPAVSTEGPPSPPATTSAPSTRTRPRSLPPTPRDNRR